MADSSSTRRLVLKSASSSSAAAETRPLCHFKTDGITGSVCINRAHIISYYDICQMRDGFRSASLLDLRVMAKPKPLIKSQYETLAAFRYALRQFIHFSEEAAHAAGITPQQYQALLAIKGFPGRESVTVGELAERLQLRHHSAVGLVDRLVAEKLVVRLPSAEDRRRVLIQLTLRGENSGEARLRPSPATEADRAGNPSVAGAALLKNEGRTFAAYFQRLQERPRLPPSPPGESGSHQSRPGMSFCCCWNMEYWSN